MKQLLNNIGIIFYFFGAILTWGWYIGWLEEYFLMADLIAFLFSFLGIPFAGVFVIMEWIWHGFPPEAVVLALILQGIGLALFLLQYFFNKTKNDKTK